MPTPTDSVIYNLDKTRLTVWFLLIVTWIRCCSQDWWDFQAAKTPWEYHSRRPKTPYVDLSFTTLGWMPYYVKSDVICLIAHKRISGACPDYISELIELNSTLTAASIVEIHEAPILTYCLEDTKKEDGRTFSVTTSKCWNHLSLK